MPNRMNERPMSESERKFLMEALKSAPMSITRWKLGTQNALLQWVVSMGLLLLAWTCVAWAVRKTRHVDIGVHSPAGGWILAIGAPICALMAGISSIRWIKKGRNIRLLLRAD